MAKIQSNDRFGFKTNTDTIMDKRLEEIKVKGDKVRKSLAEEQKSIRERQEVLRKQILIMKALDELLMENADFRKQFESKLEELISKENS